MLFKNTDINVDHYSTTMLLTIYAHIYSYPSGFVSETLQFLLSQKIQKKSILLPYLGSDCSYLWFKGRQEKSVVGGVKYKILVFEILLTGDLLSFYYLLIRKYHCRYSCLSRMILEGGKIYIITVIVIAICTKFLKDIHRFCFAFFLNKTSD